MQHVLIAGSTAELPCMRSLLSMLPSDAYGQVLVAAASDHDLGSIETPARVVVQRVAPGGLPEAVSAWMAEWIPELGDPARSVGVWVGAGVAARTDRHLHDLASLLPDVIA